MGEFCGEAGSCGCGVSGVGPIGSDGVYWGEKGVVLKGRSGLFFLDSVWLDLWLRILVWVGKQSGVCGRECDMQGFAVVSKVR